MSISNPSGFPVTGVNQNQYTGGWTKRDTSGSILKTVPSVLITYAYDSGAKKTVNRFGIVFITLECSFIFNRS